jgi:dTDP-4-dehydrorhamnose 3,5-epimerase
MEMSGADSDPGPEDRVTEHFYEFIDDGTTITSLPGRNSSMTIDGVQIRQLKVVPDERGWLMEILRCDDPLFEQFGQVYVTTAYPGVVKAWHYHKKQTDNFTCIHGMMKVALFDARPDSPTHRSLMEFFIGVRNPALIHVPPGIYHGFKAIGTETAFFLSIPTHPYNPADPDEFRVPPDAVEIPYDWGLAPGLKHG